ncbi:plasmid mobilization relaxosome protein MobC [Undibacterium sp.]|uniref:plasmid mobilization relaxosome protein MobC n=1 Tax=Undibacterium sp. TaxID=1914977 RepID=UPI003750B298
MKPIETTLHEDHLAKFKLVAQREKMKPAALLRQVVLIFLGVKEREAQSFIEDELSDKSSNEYVMKTTVSRDTSDDFSKLAKSQGLSNASFLRVLIEERLKKVAPDLEESNNGMIEIKEIERRKVLVTLPLFVYKRAMVRGRAKGMKISRWITSIVQSNLTNEPVMTHNEIIHLNASIRELAAIGRNLNQIAKALNENFHETDRFKLSELNALKNVIDHHKEKIRSLVKSSSQSWEINE